MKRAATYLALALIGLQAPAYAQPEGEGEAPPAEPETGAPSTDEDEAQPGDEPAAPETPEPESPPPPADDLPAWDAVPAEGDTTLGQNLEADWDTAAGPEAQVSFPWIESHGYFRMRTDLFYNFDLGTFRLSEGRGTSPFLPPLTETDTEGSGHPELPEHTYRRGAETQAGANIRFRYQPTIHITENLRIRTTLDLLDNLVLGSTPDAGPRTLFPGRPDSPLVTFSGTQVPPEAGHTSWYDSVRVKHLWGEWKTPLGQVVFGRTMSHWGLGVLANGGNCLDCDFGDSVDRIMGVTKLFDTYLAVAWDFPVEGAVGFPGLPNLRTQPLGQAFDFDQRDDVNQWVIAIFQRPVTRREKEQRARQLNELREPAFDWGVYNVIRTHAFEANYISGGQLPPEGRSDYQLLDTKAFAYIPDAWLSFEIRPQRNHAYQLQLEAVGIFGVIEELPQRAGRAKFECLDPTITNIDDCPEELLVRPRKRDLTQWGYALEFDARREKLKFGFHHGIASGDDTDGFGILDKIPLDSNDPRDQEITNFKFDRDYHVDLILFRELIGGVTNAAYFKPYVGYDLIFQDNEAWGFQLSALYAFAMEPRATPGNERNLGLEFDLELYIHEYDTFKWSLSYGILFPFGAFDLLNVEETAVIAEPEIAQTIQMLIGMMF